MASKSNKNQTKKWHNPLAHYKWWQSALAIALTFGGVVWATNSFIGCQILSGLGDDAGRICIKLVSSNDSGSVQEFKVKSANNDGAIGASGYDTQLIGKELEFTNNGNDALFIPLRQKRELDSFLAAKQNGNNQYANNIEVCEKNGDGSVFGNGILGCEEGDISCVQDAVCNSDLDCNGGTCGAEPVIAFGGSNNCNGFYFNNSATSCQGTPTGNTKLDWQGNAFDWQYGYIYYLNNSGNPQAIAICGADATVGNNIGIGVGPTPNGYTQCIIETHIPAGNYYQVYQFESQINYWQQFTVDNDDVITNVFQTEQFALGNATQSCNGANQSSCESVTGCNWEATDDKVSCAGATNKASCEVQASTCSWSGPVSVRL